MADEPKTYDEAFVQKLRDEAQGLRHQLEAVNGGASPGGAVALGRVQRELEAANARISEFETEKTERERVAQEAKGEYDAAKVGYEKTITDLKSAHTKELNKLTTSRLIDKAEIAAAKAGMHDPSLISKLVDTKDFKLNDDGSITGVDEAVAKLKESHAYLFKGDATETEEQRKARERAGASPGGGSGGGNVNPFNVDAYAEDPQLQAKLRELTKV